MLPASELFESRIRRASLLLTLILLCAAGAAAQTTTTFAGRDYPIIGNTQIAADFNGDGRPDMAGAGINVRVSLNNGDGTFRPYVEFPAGGFTQDVAAGDLNGDGRLDLVVTNDDERTSLHVLLGNGDGTFGAPTSFPNVSGFDSPSIALADFDRDGRLDAVVAHQFSCFSSGCSVGDSLTFWRGVGDGSFQTPQQLRVGFAPYRVGVADLNNDGNLDVGVAGGNGGVYVLLGAGDGTFRQLPDLSVVPGVDNTDLAFGEFNGDGIADIAIAADADHRTVVVVGNGDGTFRPSASIPDALQERPGELTVSDLNGDGFQDVLLGMAGCCTVSGDGMLGVLYGTGTGTFRAVTRYLVPGFVIQRGGGALIASDFNGDGKQDVALQVRGNNPGTTILTNTTGVPRASFALGSVQITPSSVVGGTQAEVNVLLAPGAVATSSTAVSVSSSRSSVVPAPTGVRILAGMTNVRVRLDTASVTTTQSVTITVSAGGSSRSATLIVTPAGAATLGSLQTQPSTVTGGAGSTGIVSLTPGTVAPSGGAVVSITNDNPSLVTTPFNVTIGAGQSSASFPITTQQTGLTTAVTITAAYAGATRSATLTVTAPSGGATVSAVTLTPSTVVGGSAQAVRALVSLSQAAPPEGANVTLSSSHPAVASLPSSLFISGGTSSGFVDFTTNAVSTTTQVTVRASYGGSTQSAVLTVNPAPAPPVTLAGVTLNPTSVTGGAASQGTVTLSGPAQSPTVVNLSSSSAVASVPASVTVPAGASSAGFSVSTTSVASSTSVTVTAVSGGVTRSATLTVNPAATTPADTVSIRRAEYNSSKRRLNVEATSSRTNATLQVFVTATGQLLGTLTNRGGGRYEGQLSVSTNPRNITVRSNFGGTATRSVSTN